MMVDRWLAYFGDPIAASDLEFPAVTAFVSFVDRHAIQIARFIEARRSNYGELVVLDFRTGKPQDSVCPIRSTERVGVRFANVDAMPVVYMLRDNFPDTEHQLLVHEGAPQAICIDDRNWAEAKLTWTPAELIHRILSWFSRAARGELHDPRQPLEPLLIGSQIKLFISRNILSSGSSLDLVAIHDSEVRQSLRVCPIEDAPESIDQIDPICLVVYSIPPEKMQRLTFAPGSLGSLARMLKPRGVDLLDDLSKRFNGWFIEGPSSAWRMNSRFAVIVEMPIIAPDGSQHDGTDLRAFVTNQSAGEIAVLLDLAMEAEPEEGSMVGFVKSFKPGKADFNALARIEVQSAEVHFNFDRRLATKIAGREVEDNRAVVMVGAGAIGSHVADCLIREGRFRWTIIDDDHLLPHNLARHTTHEPDIRKKKASLVATKLCNTLDDTSPVARPICENVMVEGSARQRIDLALEEADLIIDATASILAERYLSDHAAIARRACVFFNPAGNAAVLLVEPADRSRTLRELEAQYMGIVVRENALSGHLVPPTGTYAYTGACRAITNLIPQSRVVALSGLVADGLGKAVDQDKPVIKIWSLQKSGTVEVFAPSVRSVVDYQVGDWTTSIDQGLTQRILTMRDTHLPDETGGVLVGIVDIPAKRIQLVDATSAPPDSKASATGFERGTSGVKEHLKRVFEHTLGQVRYVGEWHSHPSPVPAIPSPTDRLQIDWLATVFDMDSLPALMLIAADDGVNIILTTQRADYMNAETCSVSKRGEDHS